MKINRKSIYADISNWLIYIIGAFVYRNYTGILAIVSIDCVQMNLADRNGNAG